MNIALKRYSPELKADWTRVLDAARNGILLFERDFIEYHGDRFHDFSYVIYLNGRPVALFPAAVIGEGNHIVSHPGLTFGGVVFRKDLRGQDAIEIVDALLDELKMQGISKVSMKMLPSFFSSYPSEDSLYALWRRGFKIEQRNLSSALLLSNRLPLNRSKLSAVKKAKKNAITLNEPLMEEFHKLLSDVLRKQHDVEPVHSLAELNLLKSRFPQRIFTRGALLDGALIAGTLIFDYGHVWHTQYLAASDHARKLGALDLVVDGIIHEADERGVRGLSFGISTTDQGSKLNQGLLWQKESYGARPILHDYISGRP